MSPATDVRGVAHFGVFEVDLSKGELRREGRPVALQRHSFLVLAALVEHAGEEVSREALRTLLWPGVEFLDFENGINTAVARLRQALHDSAETPRFIGTRRGYGYRLLAPVAWETRAAPVGQAAEPIASTAPQAPPAPARRWPSRAAVSIGAVVVLVCGVLLVGWLRGDPTSRGRVAAPERPEDSFAVYAPPGETLSGSFALSPNGRRIVFVANRQLPQQSRLWLRDLDGVAERPLPDTEGASLPFWSPDGKHLGFFAHGRLETIDVESGRIAELAAARRGRGGTWNAAGVILYAPDINSPIMSVPATGGIPVAVTDRAGAPSHRFPSFLPDGRHFIYLVLREDRHASEIGWGRLGGGENGRVLAASSNAVCTGAGQIFFARESTLFAQALDFATMRPLGSPVVVSDRVGVYGEEGPTGLGAFAVSVDGVVAITDVLRPAVRLAWFDRRGHPLPTAGPAGDYIAFDLAADDVHVAAARFDARKRSSDIVTFDLRSGVQTQVTDDPWPDAGVTWAPKGSLLAFISLREGGWTAFLRDTAQGGDERRIGPCDSLDAWSPDGGQVLCKHLSDTADGAVPLWQLPVGGSHKPGLVLEDAGIDGQARVSPDGHWLAYTRDEGLPDGQLYVAQMKSGRAAGRQSVGSGVCPRWRRDGGELFFLNGTRLMSVPVESRGVVRFGSPRVLFEAPLAPHDSLADFGVQFGVASDGTRFLIATPIETQPSVPIRITPASAIPKQGAGIE